MCATLSSIALRAAETMLCKEPSRIGDWLAAETMGTEKLFRAPPQSAHLPDLSIPELVTLLMECGNQLVPLVRDELRYRFVNDPNNASALIEYASAVDDEVEAA